MSHAQKLLKGEEKLAVVGLGYVGMPLAVAFSKRAEVIGFDLNSEKIARYKAGFDPTREVGDEAIRETKVFFTDEPEKLREASFCIVAVPTPVNPDKTPNLSPVAEASKLLGKYLRKGAVVVYESTVYPGVSEDVCVPLLEEASNLQCGKDFFIGYSPERINPGDKLHTLKNITKIVSGMNDTIRDEIAEVYSLVVDKVYQAPCIRVAEAAKVCENSQRDINIAFVNELAMAFERMGINTNDVVDAMNTKWNALGFRPGLVGGHCIGVDPYYLTYEAEQMGYHSRIISAGRLVNDGMGAFVADCCIKKLIETDKVVRRARVGVLGITFKEDCPDVRNSKVMDIVTRLREFGVEPIISDPCAQSGEVEREYGLKLVSDSEIVNMDCLIVAVAHREYRAMDIMALKSRYAAGSTPVLVDVKGIFDGKEAVEKGFAYWEM